MSRDRPRVLLVEDDPTIRETTALVLEDFGFDIDAAADGQAGLDAMRAGRYDLALLDVQPGDEFCPKHQANADALEALGDSDEDETSTCARCGRDVPRLKLRKLTERAGGGLACAPVDPENYDACQRIYNDV
mgnify:CR=1 FL=1